MINKFTAGIALFMFTTCVVSAKELSKKEKSSYSDDKTFEEICFSPEDASPKPISKHKFNISYKGQTLKVPKTFQKLLIGEQIIVKASGTDSDNILLLYKKKDKYLYSKFKEVMPDTTITIYGTLRHKTLKKVDYYYVMIEDVTPFRPKEVASSDEEGADTSFTESDYKKLSLREFQVNFTEYLGKKVYLSLHLQSIINHLNTQLQNLAGMDVEHYFIINADKRTEVDTMEPDGINIQPFGLNIVAKRSNKKITQEIINTPPGSDLFFYGRLKKLQNPSNSRSRPTYYFMLDGIKAAKSVMTAKPIKPIKPTETVKSVVKEVKAIDVKDEEEKDEPEMDDSL